MTGIAFHHRGSRDFVVEDDTAVTLRIWMLQIEESEASDRLADVRLRARCILLPDQLWYIDRAIEDRRAKLKRRGALLLAPT